MRQFFDSAIIALGALWANKLRSILTLIGMIIGVSTIIAIVSLINGMNQYVAAEIQTLGATTFTVDREGIITSEEEWWESRKRKKLTVEDYQAIDEVCVGCERVAARSITRRSAKYGNKYIDDVYIMGSTPEFPLIVDFEIENGHYPTAADYQHRRRVAFVGYDVIDNLFPGILHIGKEIRIAGQKYTVIGNGVRRGSTLGQSKDNYIIIPLSTFEKQFGDRRSVDLFVKAHTYETMDETQDEVRMVMRARHKLKYDDEDDFSITTAADIQNLWDNFSSGAFLVMIGISSISLIVGGIVIMNIMLVSVTERTREVGIRKAIGARRMNIMWQFLAESLTLSIVGGAIGIITGFLIGMALSHMSGIPLGVEVWSIIAGILVAGGVGTVFGVYPAMKAARLDPIEALRYE
ncbi:MAG: FtsX-like permease family protein [candidate division Zixibacteria bacterium]|nr:FtsX-like permease family protein [candidate division Zixibacteria bacterium]